MLAILPKCMLIFLHGQETVQPDNEATRGKISHIGYLVEVTEQK